MAYQSKDLSVLAYANGFTLWHFYHNTDKAEDLLSDGYFIPAVGMVRAGDILICTVSDGTALLLVKSIENGHVKVANMMSGAIAQSEER